MNKPKMIKIIKQDLGTAVNSASCYVHGHIPKRKFAKAKTAYVGDVLLYEDVIGLTDETLFGTGKKGILFTFDGYYYSGCSERLPYNHPISLNNSFYHLPELNQLMTRLYQASIEEPPSNWFQSMFQSILKLPNKKALSNPFSSSTITDEQWNSKIEGLEIFRSCISELNCSIGLLGISYKNHESSYADLVNSAVILTGLLSGDTLFVSTYSSAQVDGAFAQQCTKYANTIAKSEDMLNSFYPDSQNPIHIQRSIKRYRSSILRVVDHSHHSEEENVQIIFNATNRLRSVLNDVLDKLDAMVDYCYEQMDS